MWRLLDGRECAFLIITHSMQLGTKKLLQSPNLPIVWESNPLVRLSAVNHIILCQIKKQKVTHNFNLHFPDY